MFPWLTVSTVALGEIIFCLIFGKNIHIQMKQAVENWISK